MLFRLQWQCQIKVSYDMGRPASGLIAAPGSVCAERALCGLARESEAYSNVAFWK